MKPTVQQVQKHAVSDDQLRKYEEAAVKGRQWLLTRLQPGGTFNARNKNLRCYLRSPLALLMTGAPRSAYPLLDTLGASYLSEAGDFRTSAEAKYGSDRFNMKGEKNCYLYGNGWAAISAHLNGRFDISYRAIPYLLRYQDPSTGGFLSYHDAVLSPEERQDVASTCSCCYALLFCGRVAEATKAADFLLRLSELQSESDRFYLSLTRDGGLIRSFSPEDAFYYVVDRGQTKQAYWMLGYASAVLAKVYLATGQKKHLEGAVWYFDFLMSCQPDVTSFFGFWKMAWAASVLTSIFKTERYSGRATEMLDRMVSSQQEQGYWAWSLDLGMTLENDDWLVDLSSEMIVWLCELPRMLTSR
jgi:hypothetical protein